MIPVGVLERCYAAASPDQWGTPSVAHLRRFVEIEQLTLRFVRGRRVLDVGCSNGAMLASWKGDWVRFGIEPSKQAQEMAGKGGIHILGAEIREISPGHVFDLITLIDVIEHIPEPQPFLRRLIEHLAPGGLIAVLTGTTDHWWWRVAKPGYWYASFPEHVCFYSSDTFEYIASNFGARIVHRSRISHAEPQGFGRYAGQLLKNLFYWHYRQLVKVGVLPSTRWWLRGYPSFTEAKDHIFVLLERTG